MAAPPDARARYVIPGALLAGIILGVAAGGLAARVSAVTAALEKIGGPLLGNLLAGSDNLAFIGGLIGLALAALLTRGWLRRHDSRQDDG